MKGDIHMRQIIHPNAPVRKDLQRAFNAVSNALGDMKRTAKAYGQEYPRLRNMFGIAAGVGAVALTVTHPLAGLAILGPPAAKILADDIRKSKKEKHSIENL